MKDYINWFPEKDIFLKKGEVELHEKIHGIWHNQNNIYSKPKKIDLILQAEKGLDKKISGNVLDIGCSNGYSSVYIVKNRNIDQVHSLECNINCVNLLIRSNYQYHNIPEEKYELILGSFNEIHYKNYYDFVISLGAIHHSGNLLKTMTEINSCLKVGGYFIANEPYMNDFTSNQIYIEKEEIFKNVQGLVNTKESERDDHFFRKCEYLTAFYHSGFEIIKFIKIDTNPKNIRNSLIVLKKVQINKITHKWYY